MFPVRNCLLDCYIFIILTQLQLFVTFSKINNQHGGSFMEIREEKNILMTSHINLADFKAKGINKCKINNNNTITKHEFKVKYEGY